MRVDANYALMGQEGPNPCNTWLNTQETGKPVTKMI